MIGWQLSESEAMSENDSPRAAILTEELFRNANPQYDHTTAAVMCCKWQWNMTCNF